MSTDAPTPRANALMFAIYDYGRLSTEFTATGDVHTPEHNAARELLNNAGEKLRADISAIERELAERTAELAEIKRIDALAFHNEHTARKEAEAERAKLRELLRRCRPAVNMALAKTVGLYCAKEFADLLAEIDEKAKAALAPDTKNGG